MSHLLCESLEDPRRVDQAPAKAAHAISGRTSKLEPPPSELRTRKLPSNPVLQPLRAVRVEPQDPVADDLQRDAADLRRIRPPAAVIDHRKRQQPTGLVAVEAPARQAPEIVAIIVVTKINRSANQRLLFAQEAIDSELQPSGNPPREAGTALAGMRYWRPFSTLRRHDPRCTS